MKTPYSAEHIKTLLERAKGGDKQAFGDIYQLYFTPLYRYLYLRLGNRQETEDLVQTVFLKAYSSLHRFEHTGKSPLAYFFTIARNALIDTYRKKKLTVEVDEEFFLNLPADSRHTPDQINERAERMKEVVGTLQQLTEDQREVITLKFIEELETAEVAAILGKSEDAVRQIQSRGLKALRSYLKKSEL